MDLLRRLNYYEYSRDLLDFWCPTESGHRFAGLRIGDISMDLPWNGEVEALHKLSNP